MHELTTFGAVIKFAVDFEEKAAEFYSKAAVKIPETEELSYSHAKRINQLEKIRREKLNEIMLEPITGLDGDNYDFKLDGSDNRTIGEIIETASDIEVKGGMFYSDSARICKSFSNEVMRIFERLSRENGDFLEDLKLTAKN
jgi:hypothetical protein